jgi:hypothetical protein
MMGAQSLVDETEAAQCVTLVNIQMIRWVRRNWQNRKQVKKAILSLQKE